MQICIIGYSIRERFAALNCLIKYERGVVITVYEKTFDSKLFVQIFHQLSDLIHHVNSIFTFHSVPLTLNMLLIDIFGFYGIVRDSSIVASKSTNDLDFVFFFNSDYKDYSVAFRIYTISSNFFYSLMQFMLKVFAAHVGHTLACEIEKTKVIMAKYMNDKSTQHPIRFRFLSALMQFETRKNLHLQNSFFIIDWNIVLTTTTTTITFLIITCQFVSPLNN
ncbi:hypothetical protein PVAND_008875 [Polypedilum vanderplanki]|uniref:Uncharacterized protein n=1 Tax=Polypedilum vanderplanki TaxID=319348 RepID=A0A9J6CAY6_POLVA|nr:hypothetical protein PVAND_008875 [Polypedilum vanderplanki]